MINCNKIKKKLIFYIENEVSAEEKIQIEQHLAKCNECKILTDKLKESLNAINKEKNLDVNPYLSIRIIENINSVKRQKEESYENPLIRWVLQPAIFTLIAAIGIYIGILLGTFYKNNLNLTDSYTSVYWDDFSQEPIEVLLLSEE
jgi:predicted anti-sigma-YlaC factor YlaD